jgi:prepilin-type N-terminal cleavage/methylation domain-containing protein
VRSPATHPEHAQRGTSLAELMIALVVLSIGLLAVAQIFPAGSRSQLQSRMLTTANYHAQEKIESFVNLPWSDPTLDPGRHPAGTATENLGQWQRFYEVSVLDQPLDNLKRITVTVSWTFQGNRSVTATTYLRR